MRSNREDKTALSYWFPKIEAAGLPVPKTKIIRMPKEAADDVWCWLDGKPGVGNSQSFIRELERAAVEVGGPPFFLRTDHTSAKHGWEDTCFVKDLARISHHVKEIAEFSEICDMFGLPWDVWVVRELLPTIPLGICMGYRNMPVCREFRFFVKDGSIICRHPYWPKFALDDGKVNRDIDYDSLCRIDASEELSALASRSGVAVGGEWSVDVLETKRGWYVTDMAEANQSWHWPECEHNKQGSQQ